MEVLVFALMTLFVGVLVYGGVESLTKNTAASSVLSIAAGVFTVIIAAPLWKMAQLL